MGGGSHFHEPHDCAIFGTFIFKHIKTHNFAILFPDVPMACIVRVIMLAVLAIK